MEIITVVDCLNEIDSSIILGLNNLSLEKVHKFFLEIYQNKSLTESRALLQILSQLNHLMVDMYIEFLTPIKIK